MLPGSQQAQQFREVVSMAKNPRESEQVQALCTIIAELEHRQIEQVEQLHEAVGIEGIERTKSKADREDQLLGLVEALASGDLKGFWFREVASDHLDNPEDAKAYAGLDEGEWQDQIEQWASTYREKAPERAEQFSDRDLARSHVKNTFGVSLDEFEREVVEWSGGETLEQMLASNFQAVERGIETATAELTDAETEDST